MNSLCLKYCRRQTVYSFYKLVGRLVVSSILEMATVGLGISAANSVCILMLSSDQFQDVKISPIQSHVPVGMIGEADWIRESVTVIATEQNPGLSSP